MTGFLNNNQGWWGFLALLVPLVPYLWRLGRTVRTARLSDQERWRLLVTTMRNDRSLVLRQRRDEFQLPIRAEDANGVALAEPAADLFALLTAGRCVEVVGEAGAGKSYLAVEVRRTGLAVADPARVVDIVSARDWHTPRWIWRTGTVRAAELANWASRVLRRRYPHFRRSDLRHLIDDGRIVLAVDGLDEVNGKDADSLWQAIVGHASRLPVLALRRWGGGPSTVTAERLTFYEFARHTLRPLRERDVADLLRQRFTWFDQLAEARRPHLLRQALTNPLLLHIAVQVWSPTTPPREVLTSTDPRFVLWSAFLRERVGGSALSRHDPRLRRVLETIALSAESSASRLSEVNYHTRVRRVTIVLLALIVLPLGWMAGWPSIALVAVFSASIGLHPFPSRRLFGIPLPWFVQSSFVGQMVVALAATVVGYAIALPVTRAVRAMMDVIASTDLDPITALNQYGGLIFETWWSYLPSVFVLEWDFWTGYMVATGLLLLALSRQMDLAEFDDDAANFLPGWSLLPFADRAWSRLALLAVFVGFFGISNPSVDAWCVLLLATLLYKLVNLVFFAVRMRSVQCLSPRLLRGLDELGVLYAHGSRFRLVHQEIADNIALNLLQDEKDATRLAKTIPHYRGWKLVNGSTRHQDAERLWPLMRQLVRQYPQDRFLGGQACLMSLFGIGDPVTALQSVRRHRRSSNAAHLAEVYWSLRDVPRARAMFDRTVRRFPASVFVLHKATRLLVLQGELDAALRMLRDAENHVDSEDQWYCRTRAAVLMSKATPGARATTESDAALAKLLSLAEPDNLMRAMAELELARRWSEEYGEHQRALGLLRRHEATWSRRNGILWARIAQVHLRLGNDRLSLRYVTRIMDDLTWDEDPDHQLESAIVAANATGDRLATEIAERLIRYGWPQDARLLGIADDMRRLGGQRTVRPETDPNETASTGAP